MENKLPTKYQYKKIGFETDMVTLNSLGQSGWQIADVDSGDKGIILCRDTSLPIVRDGLDDHPLGSALVSVIIEPMDEIILDMKDTLSYLRSNSMGVPDYVLPGPDSSISSQQLYSDGNSTTLTIARSGLMQFKRVDVPLQNREIIPDRQWSQWVMDYMGLFNRILNHWAYRGSVRSVLTVSGLQGLKLNSSRQFVDAIRINVPYVQVEHIESVQSILNDGKSPMAKLLFEKFYWSLGIDRNLAFPE